MITLSIIIALSFSTISLVLFALVAIYWFPLWHRKKIGFAHCLFLTNALLAFSAFLRLTQIVSFFISGEGSGSLFNLIGCFILFCVAVIQFALARGYFTVQE